jgi:antitoxin (DNA-binding transcriptional repressor) of toxin-antitoxin stability system
MSERTLLATARDAVHNFTHYAAMVDAGAEVIITRRGRAPLKLVRAEPVLTTTNREALVQRALSIRSAKPFKGRFVRSEAYDE